MGRNTIPMIPGERFLNCSCCIYMSQELGVMPSVPPQWNPQLCEKCLTFEKWPEKEGAKVKGWKCVECRQPWDQRLKQIRAEVFWAQNYGPRCSPESAIKNGLVTRRDAVFRTMLPPSAEVTCFIACSRRIAAPQGRHKTLHFLIFFLFFYPGQSSGAWGTHDSWWWDVNDRMNLILMYFPDERIKKNVLVLIEVTFFHYYRNYFLFFIFIILSVCKIKNWLFMIFFYSVYNLQLLCNLSLF